VRGFHRILDMLTFTAIVILESNETRPHSRFKKITSGLAEISIFETSILKAL